MKRIAFLLLIIGALLMLSSAAHAEDKPVVTISVDKKTVVTDDTVTLQVSVTGGGIGSVGEPQIEGIENFEVLGTSSGEQVSIVNFTMTSAKTWNFTLRPRAPGLKVKLRASANIKGEKRLSNIIEIETVKGSGGMQTQPRRVPHGMFGIPGVPPFFSGRQFTKEDFTLSATVHPTKLYVGQEATYTMTFYRGVDISSSLNFNAPELKGFWTEQPPNDQRFRTFRSNTGGRTYETTQTFMLLYPLAPGNFRISPSTVMFQPDPMSQSMSVKSNELQLTVLPLPEAEKPTDFSGLVGNFSLDAKLLERSATVGKPLTLVVTVSGKGNLQSISRPVEPEWGTVEKYDPETKDEFRRLETGSEGTRTFTYILVPQKEGRLSIGTFRTNFFDPKTDRYTTLSSRPLEVTVAASPGIPGNKSSLPSPGPEATRMAAGTEPPLYENPMLYALMLASLALLTVGTVFLQKKRQGDRDKRRERLRGARMRAEERIENARRALASGDREKVLAELEHAIRNFFSDKFDIPPSSITPEMIESRMGAGVHGRVPKGAAVLRSCTAARYAPAENTGIPPQELQSMVLNAAEAIEEAEKELGSIQK